MGAGGEKEEKRVGCDSATPSTYVCCHVRKAIERTPNEGGAAQVDEELQQLPPVLITLSRADLCWLEYDMSYSERDDIVPGFLGPSCSTCPCLVQLDGVLVRACIRSKTLARQFLLIRNHPLDPTWVSPLIALPSSPHYLINPCSGFPGLAPFRLGVLPKMVRLRRLLV